MDRVVVTEGVEFGLKGGSDKGDLLHPRIERGSLLDERPPRIVRELYSRLNLGIGGPTLRDPLETFDRVGFI